jgi:hypothetical protein
MWLAIIPQSILSKHHHYHHVLGPLKINQKNECDNLIFKRSRNETGETEDHCTVCGV